MVLKHKDFIVVVEIKYARGKSSDIESKIEEAINHKRKEIL